MPVRPRLALASPPRSVIETYSGRRKVGIVAELMVVVAMSIGSIGICVLLMSRSRRLVEVHSRQRRSGRGHEVHWAAIRLRSNGHQGHDLQEMVCAVTNCTPTEADEAIQRVGADI